MQIMPKSERYVAVLLN